MIKLHDRIQFKSDIEGEGEVVEINESRYSPPTYIVAVTDPGSGNAEQVHPHARFNYKYNCMTVTVWKAEIIL